jgi:hypothetical protein
LPYEISIGLAQLADQASILRSSRIGSACQHQQRLQAALDLKTVISRSPDLAAHRLCGFSAVRRTRQLNHLHG